MSARLSRWCLLLLLGLGPALCPGTVLAATLSYSVSGLSGELKRNVEAWLGAAPDSVTARRNFVASAQQRVTSALQALGYYEPDINIDVQRREAEWQMRIVVAANEPVRIAAIDLAIEGEAEEDPAFAALLDAPGFARGDILHHGVFRQFRNDLLSLTRRRGYFDARIATSRVAVRKEEHSANVTVHLDSGRRYAFGPLQFDPALIAPQSLEALRTFQTGDPFAQDKLQRFQSQVQDTGFFAAVLVAPEISAAEDYRVPVSVTLHPAKSHSFDVGIGYSSDTEERLSLAWRTPRINRFGHSQVTRLVYSRANPSGRVSYHIPLTHPINDMLQFWGRIEDNEYGDVDSLQLELGARRERRRGNWVFGTSLRRLSEDWELQEKNHDNDYLLLGGSVSRRDQRGSMIDPAAGLSQFYSLELAAQELASDISLARFNGLLRYVVTPLPRHRLVGSTELGIAEVLAGDRDELAPSLGFYAGGNRSIRGFGYQSIGKDIAVTRADGSPAIRVTGGDRLAIASLEYQYYIRDAWRAALFIDGGDAFDDGDFEWHYGAGFGLHYLSPVGAVRIELARDISEDNPGWRLHLNIGAEF